MKKIDDIKARRQERFFNRRMAKAEAKKKQSLMSELITHSDLIGDNKVKKYIEKKKEEKRQKQLAKYQEANKGKSMGKDMEMLEDSDMEEEPMMDVEVIKTKKTQNKTKAIKKKL